MIICFFDFLINECSFYLSFKMHVHLTSGRAQSTVTTFQVGSSKSWTIQERSPFFRTLYDLQRSKSLWSTNFNESYNLLLNESFNYWLFHFSSSTKSLIKSGSPRGFIWFIFEGPLLDPKGISITFPNTLAILLIIWTEFNVPRNLDIFLLMLWLNQYSGFRGWEVLNIVSLPVLYDLSILCNWFIS